MLAQGAASLALTLKVQRAKHAINDNFHSYAVAKPLKSIRAQHTKKNEWSLMALAAINVKKPREAQIST